MTRSLEMWKAYLDYTNNHNIGDHFIVGDVIGADAKPSIFTSL